MISCYMFALHPKDVSIKWTDCQRYLGIVLIINNYLLFRIEHNVLTWLDMKGNILKVFSWLSYNWNSTNSQYINFKANLYFF